MKDLRQRNYHEALDENENVTVIGILLIIIALIICVAVVIAKPMRPDIGQQAHKGLKTP